MKNLGVPEPLWQELNNRVWHATNREGLEGIIRDGKINLGGRYQGSFCLWKEYVSLFDFVTEGEAEPNYSWMDWLGGRRGEKRISLWLELDHETAGAGFINAAKLGREWYEELDRRVSRKENEEPFRSHIFSGVEAGHQGPIPVSLLKGALLIDGNDYNIFKRHQGFDEELLRTVENFSESLTPDPELSPFEKAFKKNKAT